MVFSGGIEIQDSTISSSASLPLGGQGAIYESFMGSQIFDLYVDQGAFIAALNAAKGSFILAVLRAQECFRTGLPLEVQAQQTAADVCSRLKTVGSVGKNPTVIME